MTLESYVIWNQNWSIDQYEHTIDALIERRQTTSELIAFFTYQSETKAKAFGRMQQSECHTKQECCHQITDKRWIGASLSCKRLRNRIYLRSYHFQYSSWLISLNALFRFIQSIEQSAQMVITPFLFKKKKTIICSQSIVEFSHLLWIFRSKRKT